jgi:hypothetical protein
MAQSKAESFSAYLQAWEREKAKAPAMASGAPLAVLTVLAGTDQEQMAVQDLMTASGMGIAGFADALKNLERLGYLTVSGQPSAEIAKLTQLGKDVARLTHPQ